MNKLRGRETGQARRTGTDSGESGRGKLALPPTLILPPLLPLPMSLPTLQFTHPLLPSPPLRPFNTHSTQKRLHRNILLLTLRSLRCARHFDRLQAPDTPLANNFAILRVVREKVAPGRLARIVVRLLA